MTLFKVPGWTETDEQIAFMEGWTICRHEDQWHVCTANEERADEAWRTVMRGETLTHDKARNFIRDHNPQAFLQMLRHAAKDRRSMLRPKWLYLTIDDLCTAKNSRRCLAEHFWLATDDDCVVFCETHRSPQCSTTKELMELSATRLRKELGPLKIVFISMAFVPHTCS